MACGTMNRGVRATRTRGVAIRVRFEGLLERWVERLNERQRTRLQSVSFTDGRLITRRVSPVKASRRAFRDSVRPRARRSGEACPAKSSTVAWTHAGRSMWRPPCTCVRNWRSLDERRAFDGPKRQSTSVRQFCCGESNEARVVHSLRPHFTRKLHGFRARAPSSGRWLTGSCRARPIQSTTNA